MMRLMIAFHLPKLFVHLEEVDKNWWYPRCYEIENEPDFITVSNDDDDDDDD